MLVKDLFMQADPDDVFIAYILHYPVIHQYDTHTLEEQIEAVKNFRQILDEHIERFRTCEPQCLNYPSTIFMLELERGWYDHFDDGSDIYSIVVRDADVLDHMNTEFTFWNHEGPNNIDFYGMDMTPFNELTGYHIADDSVKTIGVASCCAEILHDLFEFGLSDKQREQNIKELIKSIQESENETSEEYCCTTEELNESLYHDILDVTEDENEQRHLTLEYMFEQEKESSAVYQELMEIENKESEEISIRNHRALINEVKAEFESRKNKENINVGIVNGRSLEEW